MRTASIQKGDEFFIFRCKDGCEQQAVDALSDAAMDEASPIDWFDASMLAYQLGGCRHE
ncbi:MAG: hypothetical protein ACPGXK_00095 [Phycisphaerae bacterium]